MRNLRSMLFVTLRDLRYRAKRVVVVTVGTALIFTLLLLMAGLSTRFELEPGETVDGMGASVWILPEGATSGFSSVGAFDAGIAASVRGARRVDPIITTRYGLLIDDSPTDVMMVGFARGALGQPALIAGRLPRAAGEIAIDDTAGVGIGSSAVLAEREVTVVGLTENRTLFGGTPLLFLPIAQMRAQFHDGRPIATALLAAEPPTSVPAGFDALPAAAIEADAARPLEKATSSVKLVTFLLWLVSALIIGGVVLLSAMERQRDFAVMKAVGARTRWLLGSLTMQAVLIVLVASATAISVQSFVAPLFPMKVHVTTRALIQLPVTALIVAVLAGIAGMRQVARTDPAAAFAGPGA